MNKIMNTFEKAKVEDLESGSLKFSSDYVSRKQLFEAVSKWAESDVRVLRASIRPGGNSQYALDFSYDTADVPESDKRGATLHKIFKPTFEKLLGGDYMVGWDYGSATYIVK